MLAGLPIPTQNLKASDLLLRGFFHDRIIPPLNSASLQPAISDLLTFAAQDFRDINGRKVPKVTSRCSRHSVPKQKLARRILAIPNPRNQALLALEVEANWVDFATGTTAARAAPAPLVVAAGRAASVPTPEPTSEQSPRL